MISSFLIAHNNLQATIMISSKLTLSMWIRKDSEELLNQKEQIYLKLNELFEADRCSIPLWVIKRFLEKLDKKTGIVFKDLNKKIEKKLPTIEQGEGDDFKPQQTYEKTKVDCLGCQSRFIAGKLYRIDQIAHPFVCFDANISDDDLMQKIGEAIVCLHHQERQGFVMVGGSLESDHSGLHFSGLPLSEKEKDPIQEKILDYLKDFCPGNQNIRTNIEINFVQCCEEDVMMDGDLKKKWVIRIKVTPPCNRKVFYLQREENHKKAYDVFYYREHHPVKLSREQLYQWMISRQKEQIQNAKCSKLFQLHQGFNCQNPIDRNFHPHEYSRASFLFCQESFYKAFTKQLTDNGINYKRLPWKTQTLCKKKNVYAIGHDDDIFTLFMATKKRIEKERKTVMKHKPFITEIGMKITIPYRNSNKKLMQQLKEKLEQNKQTTTYVNTSRNNAGWLLSFQIEEGAFAAYQIIRQNGVQDAEFRR